MKYVLLVLLMAIALPCAAGDIYKWVDEKGKVHFGDRRPGEKATQSSVVNPQINVTEFKRSPELETSVSEQKTPASLPPRNLEPYPEEISACEAEWRTFDKSASCFNACPKHFDGMRFVRDYCDHCKEVLKPKCKR